VPSEGVDKRMAEILLELLIDGIAWLLTLPARRQEFEEKEFEAKLRAISKAGSTAFGP